LSKTEDRLKEINRLKMNVDEPPSDDLGEGERQDGMDEEDESRSQGSIVDGMLKVLLLVGG